MKKIFYLLTSLCIILLLVGNGNTAQAQCNDAHGAIAFTGYNIADPTFPQVNKDQFSFVVLDSIPKDTEIKFTDRGWTGSGFQDFSMAATDGELSWKATTGVSAGTHIVVTLNGTSSTASVGSVSNSPFGIKLGIAGDQLFAYNGSPIKIHAAMLINKAAWDTEVHNGNVPDFSSSESLKPDMGPRQAIAVAHLQGNPAVDQEDAFQAKLNPITLIGGREALRTQLFEGAFTTESTGTVDLTVSPITWNVAPPTYTTLTLANKKLAVNGVKEACYYKWQKSTDGFIFTDITEGGAFTDTEKANLSINSALAQDTWFRVRLTGGKSIMTEAKLVKALKINTQPVDQFACPASTVSFSIAAVGEGALTYKWQQRTTPTGSFEPISDGGIFSGTATSTLTLNSPTYSLHNYAYRCIVTDVLSSLEGNPATLTVSNLGASITARNVGCFGTATGSIDLIPTGGTAPYTFKWDDNDNITTEDRDNLPAGTYSVTVTDAKGCEVTKIITITQPSAELDIEVVSVINPSVYGASDAQILIDVTGGTIGYTYQWFKGGAITAIATTKDLLNIGAGVYKVVVTDANGCVQTLENMELVNPNAKPVVTTSAGTTTYTEGGQAVVVDSGISISDQDNSTLTSATVNIRGNFRSAEDSLSFTNDGSTMGNVIAVYNKTAGQLDLSSAGASATLAQWQSALRAVSYTNTSQNPNTAERTISFKVNDGSLESTAASKLVSVTAVNDPPVNSVPEAQSVYRDATLLFNAANNNLISISDVDGEAGMAAMGVTLTATNGTITLGHINGLTIGSPATGSNDITIRFWGTLAMVNDALDGLVFTPTLGFTGAANIQIETNDGGNTGSGGAQTTTSNIAITVKPPNPKVSSVRASTPDGTYKLGDNISITVEFDQVVNVNETGGKPTLLLEAGSVDRSATYESGNGGRTLTFTYTVQSGDQSNRLDYQSTAALALNGAIIKNVHGDDAILTLSTPGAAGSLGANSAIVIDGVVPTVTSVSVPANGTYRLHDYLDFTVYFSKSVTVNKGGGTPRLVIEVAGQTVYAGYTSGTGTAELTFRYQVASGLEDHNGIAIGLLTLNGGVISDIAGNNAVLTLNSVGNTSGVKVDSKPSAIPTGFIATGEDRQISLVWAPNVESDFDKYLLYVKPKDAAKTLLATIPKGRNSYVYTGLANGVACDFFLIAVDRVGNQSAEAPASAKTKEVQTISFAALTDLTYGQQGVGLSASASSNLPVSFTSSDPGIAQVYQDNNDAGKWKINAKKVGTVTITATQAGNNEYLPATAVGNSLTIVPASLVVTADVKTKVYGRTDPVLTYTVKASDLRNGDASSVVTGKLTRVAGENVGSYDINDVSLSAENYDINYQKAQLAIVKAKQTIRFVVPEVLARDAGTVSLDVHSDSGLPVSLSVDDSSIASLSGADLLIHTLGTIHITATQDGDLNHEAAAPVTVRVKIVDSNNPLPIKVDKALSPNGDGINDFLLIEGIRDYPENKVTIFDKNGAVLAEIDGYNNRDRVFSGNDHREGTYYYFIDVKDGNVWKREKGFFVIRR